MSDQPADRRGPSVFGYLGADEATRVPEPERDRIARELRRALHPDDLAHAQGALAALLTDTDGAAPRPCDG